MSGTERAPRYIPEEAVRAAMTPELAFDIILHTYQAQGRGRVMPSQPSLMVFGAPGAERRFRAKGAVLAEEGIAAMRLLAPGHGLSALWDLESGRPLALVEESWLYRFRTAVSAAVAARLLAPGARRLGLVGTGQIAAGICRYLPRFLPIEEIRVAGRSASRAAAFADSLGGEVSVPLYPARDAAEALEGAPLAISITTTDVPVVTAAHLAPGACYLAMGGVPEGDFSVLAATERLVVDDLDYALSQGTLAGWVKAGRIGRDAVAARMDATLGEIAAGRSLDRSPEGRILGVVQGFTGCDIALALEVFRQTESGTR